MGYLRCTGDGLVRYSILEHEQQATSDKLVLTAGSTTHKLDHIVELTISSTPHAVCVSQLVGGVEDVEERSFQAFIPLVVFGAWKWLLMLRLVHSFGDPDELRVVLVGAWNDGYATWSDKGERCATYRNFSAEDEAFFSQTNVEILRAGLEQRHASLVFCAHQSREQRKREEGRYVEHCRRRNDATSAGRTEGGMK